MSTTAAPLITAREAAERLRCHERTVRRMIARQELPGRLVAGRYLIDPADLPSPESIVRVAEPRRRPRPPKPPTEPGRYRALVDRMGQGPR